MGKVYTSLRSGLVTESSKLISSRRRTVLISVIAIASALGLGLSIRDVVSADAGVQKGSGLLGGKSTAQSPGSVVSPTKTAVVNFMELAAREATNPPVPKLPKTHEVMPVPETPARLEGVGQPSAEPKLSPPAPNVPSPAPLAQFQALTDNNAFIPPDVHGAAGPSHLVTTLNTQTMIQNKSGTIISTLSTFAFWSPLGIVTISDPRVLYDPFQNRWMQTIIVDYSSANSSICVAVSQNSDPTGTWFLYRIDVDTAGTKWADFPSIGFNKNWIVVSVNMYPVPTGNFTNARTLVCVKNNLYNNTTPIGTFKFFDLPISAGGTIQPAVTMDNTTETEYFVNHDTSSAGTARIYTVTGPIGSEAMNVGPAVTSTLGGWTFGSQADPDLLPQQAAANVAHDEPRWRSVVFRNGSIWGCQQILLPAGGSPNRSSVQWWQLTTTGAVTQMGRIDDPTGVIEYGYPSIAVNKLNDVLIGYSRFSPAQFPSANYAYRAGTDPLGTLRDDRLLKAGESCYVKTFGGGHNRWGDYSMTCVDPVNDFDMWTIQQYAATASAPGCGDGSGMWATWWGKVAGGVTQADLTTFAVKGYDRGQYLEWRTSGETSNLGFNLYRDGGGKRLKLNSEIVAGSALVTGQVSPLGTGRNYGWFDAASPGSDMSYWLEELDLHGDSKWHGPVSIDKLGGSPPSQTLAATLATIGNHRGRTGAAVRVARTASLPRSNASQSFPLASLASQPAVKIAVKQDGLYRITQAQLVAAGLNPAVDPHLLQLYVDGQQQAIKVAGESDGSFDASDWVEFYGLGLDVPSTDTRVYWLAAGTQPGLRIGQVSAGGSGPPTGTFTYTVEFKERGIYFSSLINGEKENFFGAVIAGSPVNQSLTLQNVDTAATSNAVVEVAIQGVTFVPHSVSMLLNGVTIGQLTFDYQSEGTISIPVAHSMLVQGENVVTFIRQNGSSDLSIMDYVRITYQHTFRADGNSLSLSADGGQPLTIDGFTNSQIRVFDVTQPGLIQELNGTIGGAGSNYSVALTLPGKGPRALLAVASDQIKNPASLKPNQPSSWRVPARGADLIIVGYTDFLSSLDPLKQTRQAQGLSVSVVDMEDVYDEFSFGHRTPQALKDFLEYTTTTWKKKPRFVLLAGDASFDSRNYMGAGDFEFVPSKLIDTVFMETSCDDWFADFDFDGIPEIAMGRFPVRSAQETALVVQKVLAYEKSTKADSVLLVADTPDIYDFEAANSALISLLPGSIKTEIVNRAQVGDAEARSQILAALNVGQRIVNYTGHGNVDQWRGNLLIADDAPSLTNDRHLSLFVLMTCLNGYFNDPSQQCIGEAMLKAPNGGAAAVWASTGQCGPLDQSLTNQEFYRLIFNGDPVTGKPMTLGEAAVKAKRAINDYDVRRTWVLFGDPSMKFK